MSRSKYGAVRTKVDGRSFMSKKEAARYRELLLLQKAGEIEGLTCQPRFPIYVNGVKICHYVADFDYISGKEGRVVEDVKGVRLPIYKIKRQLMLAVHGIVIKET